MTSPSSPLTAHGLSAVLAALDPDPERAADRYEALRARLVKFFAWQGVPTAEECVDVTIDRVARRLSEGTQILASDPTRYFHGVARNILREHRAAQAREIRYRAHWPRAVVPRADAPDDGALASRECLQICLEELPAPDRELLLEYYRDDGSCRIANRRAIAARLGIDAVALRVRMHRLRARIEESTLRRLGVPSEELTAAASTASASAGRTRPRP
jgi:DNA-directed RNA polymerase specialized sigma24 family protein